MSKALDRSKNTPVVTSFRSIEDANLLIKCINVCEVGWFLYENQTGSDVKSHTAQQTQLS